MLRYSDKLRILRTGKSGTTDYITTLNSNIGRVNVYVGEDSKLHFVNKDGADSVLPFSSGKKVFDLGVSTSFDVSSICSSSGIDPTSLTASNFLCEPETYSMNAPINGVNASGGGYVYAVASVSLQKSYTSPTLNAYYKTNSSHYGDKVHTTQKSVTYNSHAYLIV